MNILICSIPFRLLNCYVSSVNELYLAYVHSNLSRADYLLQQEMTSEAKIASHPYE